uniref:CCHC-type domain-containing protein n=1 Tax=Sinocyclocheilus rhinocerous TaxID=307959 RepID=A0A673HXQ7_9TELE
ILIWQGRHRDQEGGSPKLTPERDLRAVTVLIYSERIKVEDTATWLSMHCTVLNTSLMRDEDGIKTGASKFQVRLKKDAEGNYHHLPSLIQLGPIRGYVFYNGQPKECRKFGSLDHIAANCELEICRHCKSKEHGSKDCQLPKKCNLCGAESHRFRDCPHSQRVAEVSISTLSKEELPPLSRIVD